MVLSLVSGRLTHTDRVECSKRFCVASKICGLCSGSAKIFASAETLDAIATALPKFWVVVLICSFQWKVTKNAVFCRKIKKKANNSYTLRKVSRLVASCIVLSQRWDITRVARFHVEARCPEMRLDAAHVCGARDICRRDKHLRHPQIKSTRPPHVKHEP